MLLIFWKILPNFGYLEIERKNPECGEPSELQLVLGRGGGGGCEEKSWTCAEEFLRTVLCVIAAAAASFERPYPAGPIIPTGCIASRRRRRTGVWTGGGRTSNDSANKLSPFGPSLLRSTFAKESLVSISRGALLVRVAGSELHCGAAPRTVWETRVD